MYKKIAITNRKLCSNLLEKITKLDASDYDHIILREKDLPFEAYLSLADMATELSNKVILHNHVKVCEMLKCYKIHLPFNIFKNEINRLNDYEIIGVSIHSLKEAQEAEILGASYITASPVFTTKCKENVNPKGLQWLKDICKGVSIPVYALGGVNEENSQSCIEAGAEGVCMMSEAMK